MQVAGNERYQITGVIVKQLGSHHDSLVGGKIVMSSIFENG